MSDDEKPTNVHCVSCDVAERIVRQLGRQVARWRKERGTRGPMELVRLLNEYVEITQD